MQDIVLKGIAIRAAKRAVMRTLSSAQISCACGVEGDSRGKPSARQVTLLSADSWQQVCAHYGRPLSWLTRRANLLITGHVFSTADVGCTLTIGTMVLLITRECNPCYRMDEQVAGLTKLLMPPFTAGVCAKVLRGGVIGLNDKVIILPPPQQACLW